MKGLFRQILVATFGLAVFVVILEHAGAFSQVLGSGVGAWQTGYQTLTGHATTAAATAAKKTG